MLLLCKRRITFCNHLAQVLGDGGRGQAGQLYLCMLQDFSFYLVSNGSKNY